MRLIDGTSPFVLVGLLNEKRVSLQNTNVALPLNEYPESDIDVYIIARLVSTVPRACIREQNVFNLVFSSRRRAVRRI